MLLLKAFILICSGEATLAHEMMFGQFIMLENADLAGVNLSEN